MNQSALAARRAEFEGHIWNHADDAFQKAFDVVPPLTASHIAAFQRIVNQLSDGADEQQFADAIRHEFSIDPSFVRRFLQSVGLTRNKILQDMKSITAADAIRIPIPASSDRLHARDDLWKVAGRYLELAARRVFTPLAGSQPADSTFRTINEATWPGWIRQERAKRQGHEAEARVARLLQELGIPFEPLDKAEFPLQGDIRINGISYDIVSPSTAAPFLVLKSTVQTSNIGQFGQSKTALELKTAREALAPLKTRPILVAFLDGVGFRSNPTGLSDALTVADEFAQFRSIWKVAVIAAAGSARMLQIALPPGDTHHGTFFEDWQVSATKIELTDKVRANSAKYVEAGEALVRVV